MAVEKKRGCGYRKVGGIYLVGKGVAVDCDRMPYPLVACPTCGAEVKFSRGFQWLNAKDFFGEHEGCKDKHRPNCPICQPPEGKRYGLMWVGEKYYTPTAFVSEAIEMGVSKRIGSIPPELKLGETRVVLAHKAVAVEGADKPMGAIFYSFVPTAIEKIITESQSKDPDVMQEIKQQGMTAVIVPDDDVDHMADGLDADVEKVLNFEMEPAPEL